MTKNSPKSKSNKYIFYSLISISVFLLCIYVYKQIRNLKFDEGSFKAYGMVEKIDTNAFDGKTAKKDIVYFFFIKNDTVFNKIKHLPNGSIKKHNINLKDCFELTIAKSDYSIFDIDFEKKKDTVLKKSNYTNQHYTSNAHKKLLE